MNVQADTMPQPMSETFFIALLANVTPCDLIKIPTSDSGFDRCDRPVMRFLDNCVNLAATIAGTT